MYQSLQRWRKYTQTFFFILFLIAPVFNIFRFDLNEQQFWFFGMRWSLGLEAFQHGKISVMVGCIVGGYARIFPV